MNFKELIINSISVMDDGSIDVNNVKAQLILKEKQGSKVISTIIPLSIATALSLCISLKNLSIEDSLHYVVFEIVKNFGVSIDYIILFFENNEVKVALSVTKSDRQEVKIPCNLCDALFLNQLHEIKIFAEENLLTDV